MSCAPAIIEVIRSALAAMEHLDPVEQDLIVATIVADLRARRPVAVAPLGVLPAPTERIVDPRSDQTQHGPEHEHSRRGVKSGS